MFWAKFIAVRSGPNRTWMGFKHLENSARSVWFVIQMQPDSPARAKEFHCISILTRVLIQTTIKAEAGSAARRCADEWTTARASKLVEWFDRFPECLWRWGEGAERRNGKYTLHKRRPTRVYWRQVFEKAHIHKSTNAIFTVVYQERRKYVSIYWLSTYNMYI